jgi:enoyl-CoA hydratase
VSYDSYEFVRTRLEGGVMYLTLSRPEVMNACSEQDHAELGRIIEQIGRDDDVKVIVATGAGRAFSVGGDTDLIEAMVTDADTRERVERDARGMIHSLIALEKPLIVAMNGVAMGGGLAFALMGDFIIAEEGKKFTDGHMLISVAAGDGGALIWPLYSGLLRAKKYLLTGDFISAEEAERIGMVTEVVAAGTSLERATEIAQRLAGMPQLPIRYTKRALNQWFTVGSVAFDLSCAYEFLTFGSPETGEVVHKFLADREAGRAERAAQATSK